MKGTHEFLLIRGLLTQERIFFAGKRLSPGIRPPLINGSSESNLTLRPMSQFLALACKNKLEQKAEESHPGAAFPCGPDADKNYSWLCQQVQSASPGIRGFEGTPNHAGIHIHRWPGGGKPHQVTRCNFRLTRQRVTSETNRFENSRQLKSKNLGGRTNWAT